MKQKYYYLFGIIFCACIIGNGQVSFDKTWDGNQINVLVVANINGSITITGHEKSTILVNGTKDIDATHSKEIDMVYEQRGDTLAIYIKSPCHTFQLTNSERKSKNSTFHYLWNQGEKCKEPNYHIDFKLQIPEDLTIYTSTINNGDISVKNFSGEIWANNINGSIDLVDIAEAHHAKTINGNVSLTFKSHPNHAGTFYTLNGDIQALFDPGLNANVSFKSFNGDFYTNIESVEILPNTMEKEKTTRGIKYKIDKATKIRLGKGGVDLDFETFNGNAILKFKS